MLKTSNKKLSQLVQHIEFPKWKWDSGSSEILTDLARDVVRKTIRMLPTNTLINSNLPSSEENTGFWVITMTNTSKNNNRILLEAMRTQLTQAGFVVAKRKDSATYILTGRLMHFPTKSGRQKVEIVWNY